MTLFRIILVVVMSVVLVVNSPGHLTKLAPGVMQTLLGTNFCGRKSTTQRAYVGVFPSAYIFEICGWFITKIQFFSLVFVLSSPSAMCPIALPKPVCHVSHTSGLASRASFLYWGIVSPIFVCTTAAQKCSMWTS